MFCKTISFIIQFIGYIFIAIAIGHSVSIIGTKKSEECPANYKMINKCIDDIGNISDVIIITKTADINDLVIIIRYLFIGITLSLMSYLFITDRTGRADRADRADRTITIESNQPDESMNVGNQREQFYEFNSDFNQSLLV